jgi:hypothetical protein
VLATIGIDNAMSMRWPRCGTRNQKRDTGSRGDQTANYCRGITSHCAGSGNKTANTRKNATTNQKAIANFGRLSDVDRVEFGLAHLFGGHCRNGRLGRRFVSSGSRSWLFWLGSLSEC